MIDPVGLTVDACLAAVDAAGLTIDDIDGLSTYPGSSGYVGGHSEGVTPIEEALRIHPTWINGGGDIPGQAGALIAAMLAVHAGLPDEPMAAGTSTRPCSNCGARLRSFRSMGPRSLWSHRRWRPERGHVADTLSAPTDHKATE